MCNNPYGAPLERCYSCDEPTGRAGIDEDSLYIEDPKTGGLDGPYCEECYGELKGMHDE